MKSEDRVKQELSKVQQDIKRIESEIEKHNARITELQESLSKTSSGDVEELIKENKSTMKQIREHVEEKSYLMAPLKSLQGREGYLRKRLFEFETERQIEQHNQRMIALYGMLKSYNELVEQANSKLEEIRALYHQQLPEEYREGVDLLNIVKCPIGSPHHIPSQAAKSIPIWNEEKILEAKSNG